MSAAAEPTVLGARLAPVLPRTRRLGAWMRRRLFNGPHNVLLTAFALWLLYETLPGLLRWAVMEAVWQAADSAACSAANGACWAVIGEKWRVFLFGTYPYEEHWRAGLATALLIALCIATAIQRLRRPPLLLAWVCGAALALLLLHGELLGLRIVRTEQWGGLPLTMLLFVGSVAGGLPLAVMLAMGRRSPLPFLRVLCTTYIEFMRGIPLVNVLFMASLMIPLFLPPGISVDKLLRALLGMTLFFAAYSAEVIRGGLQSIPAGQYEAARALGFGYWGMHLRVVLPQALGAVIPPLVNDVIRAFKNTSFVLIIGLFDLLGATSAAMAEPRWARHYVEAYLFVALIYLAACTSMSRYGDAVERRIQRRSH
jgi:general L-amino acid transport system permease protein